MLIELLLQSDCHNTNLWHQWQVLQVIGSIENPVSVIKFCPLAVSPLFLALPCSAGQITITFRILELNAAKLNLGKAKHWNSSHPSDWPKQRWVWQGVPCGCFLVFTCFTGTLLVLFQAFPSFTLQRRESNPLIVSVWWCCWWRLTMDTSFPSDYHFPILFFFFYLNIF